MSQHKLLYLGWFVLLATTLRAHGPTGSASLTVVSTTQTSSLSGGLPTLNFAYNAVLFDHSGVSLTGLMSIRGGNAPYAWRVSSGSLPPGVTLINGALVFSSAPSSWAFTLTVTDSSGATLSYFCTSVTTTYAPQGTITWKGR